MRTRKLSHIVFAVFAIVLMGSASAYAAPKAGPLPPNQIPMYAQPLDQLTAGLPVAIPAFNAVPHTQDISLCEFQTNILPPGTFGSKSPAPATWVWGYIPNSVCPNNFNPVTGVQIVQNHSYLGPVVVAVKDAPTTMNFYNKLPDASASMVQAYSLSTDQTLIWGDPLSFNPMLQVPRVTIPYNPAVMPAEYNDCQEAAKKFHLGNIAALPAGCLDFYGFTAGVPWALPAVPSAAGAPVPAAVHIHGGEVPAVLDGGPDAWFTGNGIYGHGFYSKGGVADAAAGKMVYVYPNSQEAAPVWFHDHILGATRLNVYAGIAGGYYIASDPLGRAANLSPGLLELGLDRNRDNVADLTLDAVTGIPKELLIPLIIQDRQFDKNGQLFFPTTGINPEHPYWIPEFEGNVIAVNGKVWPFVNVEAQRYRFLVLNGSNARAYELGFVDATPKGKGKPLAPPVMPTIWVIGNDQGYLQTPQAILPTALPPANKLVIMPGERYEVIVDFTAFAGMTLNMTNTGGFPYPLGVPVDQYTGSVMQFRVGAAPAVADNSFNPAVPGAVVRTDAVVRLTDSPIIHKRRQLTLNEVMAAGGPLEILVNNTLYEGAEPGQANTSLNTRTDFKEVATMNYNFSYYSELPNEGETELWEIINMTVDAHPMHPHLVAFQVLDRQAFDAIAYPAAYDLSFPTQLYQPGFGPPLDYNCTNPDWQRRSSDPFYPSNLDPTIAPCILGGNPDVTPFLLGARIPPSAQETGWKDTVMAPPGMVTRILVRFAPTHFAATDNADTLGYIFDPGDKHGYVWHCHIIDHEDNEMMRPYLVQTNTTTPPLAPAPGDWTGHTFIGGGVNY